MVERDTIDAVVAALKAHQESELLIHARVLLSALDKGFLNYKPDIPESAFVADFRAAIARAEKERV